MVCESETILSSVHWDRPVCDHTWGRFELIVGSNHVCMLSSMHFPFSFVPYRVSKGVNFEVRMLDGNLGMAPHPWLLFDVHQTRIVL